MTTQTKDLNEFCLSFPKPIDELHPDELVKRISQRIPRSLPACDNYYHVPAPTNSNATPEKEDPIVKELSKLYPHKSGMVTYRVDHHEENEIVVYSGKLQELLYLLLEEKHLDDNIRISIESSLFDLTCYLPNPQVEEQPEEAEEIPKLTRKQKLRKQYLLKPNDTVSHLSYPNNYRSKIVIENYEYLLKFSSTYFNLSLASHITKFMVELIYSLNYWEVVHLVYMNPDITYFLKLIDFEIIETSFGPLIKPPENYLCDVMLQGLQYPFPYSFYNYSYHSFDSRIEQNKFDSVKINPYLGISLKQQDMEPPKKKKKRGRKPKLRLETEDAEEPADEEAVSSKHQDSPDDEEPQTFEVERDDDKDLSTTEEIQSVKEESTSIKQEPQQEYYNTPTLPGQVQQMPHPQQEQNVPPPPPPPQVYGPPPSLAMYAMSRPMQPHEQYSYYQYQQQDPQQGTSPRELPIPRVSSDNQGQQQQQHSLPSIQVQPEYQPVLVNQRYEYRPGEVLPPINKLTEPRQMQDQQSQQSQQMPMFPFQNQLKFIPQSPNRAQSSGGSLAINTSSISPTIDSPQSGLLGSPRVDGDSSMHQMMDQSYMVDDKGKKKPGVIHQCHLTDPSTMSKCLKIFYGKNELLRHQEFVHATKKKIYKCIYCSRNGAKVQSYPRHDSLARHIRRKHGVTGKENKMAVNYAKENVEIIDESNQLVTQPHNFVEPLPHPGFLNQDYSVKDTGGFWSFRSKGQGEGGYEQQQQQQQQQQSSSPNQQQQQVISSEIQQGPQQGPIISLPPLGARDDGQYQGQPQQQSSMPMYMPVQATLIGVPEYRPNAQAQAQVSPQISQVSPQVEQQPTQQQQSQPNPTSGRTTTVLPSMHELDSSHSFGIHSRPFADSDQHKSGS